LENVENDKEKADGKLKSDFRRRCHSTCTNENNSSKATKFPDHVMSRHGLENLSVTGTEVSGPVHVGRIT